MGTLNDKKRINKKENCRAQAHQAQALLAPRLLDLAGAVSYLGVSPWTIRDLEAAGLLPRVRIPLPNGREFRKLPFDVTDLDEAIESWEERPFYASKSPTITQLEKAEKKASEHGTGIGPLWAPSCDWEKCNVYFLR